MFEWKSFYDNVDHFIRISEENNYKYRMGEFIHIGVHDWHFKNQVTTCEAKH
jgi:hypothetical protein